MAILASRAGMEFHVEEKSVHPFFEKRLKTRNDPSISVHGIDPTISLVNQSTAIRSENESSVGRGRRSSNASMAIAAGKVDTQSIQFELHTTPYLLDIDPNHGRRKRVKSTSPEAGQPGIVVEREAKDPDYTGNSLGQPPPRSNRVLRLNPRTGTIGSPPLKNTTKSSPRVGGRSVSVKTAKYAQCLVVTMRYGLDVERRSWLGQKIEGILSGVRLLSAMSKPSRISNECPRVGVSSKSTHPFFLGQKNLKASIPPAEEDETEEVVEEPKRQPQNKMMTLGEARTHSPRKRTLQAANSSAFRNFGKTAKTIKYPGAVEPCWPPKGMSHVRGLDEIAPLPLEIPGPILFLAERKSKYASMEIPGAEDILNTVASNLNIANVLKNLMDMSGDRFSEPEKSLRLPKKHFETGLQVQSRVKREVLAQLPSLHAKDESITHSEDELQAEEVTCSRAHAALLKTYGLIPSQLTAFDRSEYETQSWVHKYAPCTAGDVLQCGKEAFILKDWLQALMVVSVDRGSTESGQSRAGSVQPKRSKIGPEKSGKKKRKSDQLKGFVVSSDDDIDDLDEISDPEAGSSMHEGIGPTVRTVLRSRDLHNSHDARKVRNAVLISGPSGCGKTAMVYAVAKELCFEVFEINSSSRRSGKEILERVGDMTRNHLVQHSHIRGPQGIQSEDTATESDSLEAELKSGRQGTMKSFFKPKNATEFDNSSKSAKTRKNSSENGSEKFQKPSPRKQKQSLILLEEVDVLFEEDKQFWTTVMSLIAQSRRPVIMTCNDEAVVPLQSLNLHAIIRPTPPPLDVATDYMILVAAAEGHIVPRQAVKTLYEARGLDLRASIAELDYWCQLGVGDCKGGLDWFYPRWPPGSDVDKQGNTIRVMSEGTYKTGMGWLGRDFTFKRFNELEVKEEVLRQAWDGWNIYMDVSHHLPDAASLHSDIPSQDRLKCIESYETFTASMSLADVCSIGSLAADNQILLDKTSPPLPAKYKDDYVIGYELLESNTLDYFDPLHRKIAFWIQCQAENLPYLGSPVKRQPVFESQINAMIANASSKQDDLITRKDFSIAFDPIAEPERSSLYSASLECSVFDRTTSIIAEDVAPYVRSIVAYDAKLQQERARLSNLLSEGGRKGKRLRTTRSALSALEGGPRKTTRPEKYFRVPINAHLVRNTGMQCWEDAVTSEMRTGDGNLRISRDGSEDVFGVTDSA